MHCFSLVVLSTVIAASSQFPLGDSTDDGVPSNVSAPWWKEFSENLGRRAPVSEPPLDRSKCATFTALTNRGPQSPTCDDLLRISQRFELVGRKFDEFKKTLGSDVTKSLMNSIQSNGKSAAPIVNSCQCRRLKHLVFEKFELESMMMFQASIFMLAVAFDQVPLFSFKPEKPHEPALESIREQLISNCNREFEAAIRLESLRNILAEHEDSLRASCDGFDSNFLRLPMGSTAKKYCAEVLSLASNHPPSAEFWKL